MIYLVSSFYRSGTSMMMRCLEAGGMKIAYTMKQTNHIAFHGYEPTPDGVYETASHEFRRPDFIQVYDGKALKIPLHTLLDLPKHEYKLLFMLRKPESIRQSMLRYSPTALFWNEDLTWFYSKTITVLMEELDKRGDFNTLMVQYEDIINDPIEEFTVIYDFGFPIDVKKASKIVDARLERNNIERIKNA